MSLLSSSDPRSRNSAKETDKNVDNQMDSGFMSSSNLLTSSSLCSEDMSREHFPENTSSERLQSSSKLTSFHNLDSGIDLSEKISCMNLEEEDRPTTQTSQPSKLSQLGLSPSHIAILKEIYKKDNDGDTQLHVAVIRGFVEVVWHITRLLPHQALLDIPNRSGRTPLHLAVANGDASLARHLIVCGASPVAKNRRGDTPLHIACRNGDPAMVSSLTSQVTVYEVVSARLSYPPVHTSGLLAADLTNHDGQTCIHISAQFGHQEVLQHLTWYGADVNAKDLKCGRTAVHIAVEYRNVELIRFLVESCRAAVNCQNYAGLTPYQLAFVNDAPEILRTLEELGSSKDSAPDTLFTQDEWELEEDCPRLDTNACDYNWSENDLRIAGIPRGHDVALSTSPVPASGHGAKIDLDSFL